MVLRLGVERALQDALREPQPDLADPAQDLLELSLQAEGLLLEDVAASTSSFMWKIVTADVFSPRMIWFWMGLPPRYLGSGEGCSIRHRKSRISSGPISQLQP